MAITRERALEAAVRLVGEQGVRALTHVRVDTEAGLPKGSTSNWFRTRDALVAGVLVWIAEQEHAELTAAMEPAHTVDEVIDVFTRLLEDATGRSAVRTRARYALFLETTATPKAQPSMRAQRSMFEDGRGSACRRWVRRIRMPRPAPCSPSAPVSLSTG